MKKHIYNVGAFALALAMSALPAVALAENGGDGQRDGSTDVQVQTEGTDASVSVTARAGVSGDQRKGDQERAEATSSDGQQGDENVSGEDQNKQEIELELEDDSNPASSLDDLKQKIEVRKHELEKEVASSTEADKNIVENANPVRLAVHSLLASKELLGGIGQQVSEIAKSMNDSVATTTNVEAKIQSRGFLTRLFFGGDSAAANVISQEVAQNQQRIDDLNKLLSEANVSADIKATLTAQIAAIQDAQARLQDLAQREQKMWGLFSWRF